MTKVCKKHTDKPVKIYSQCIGCEVELLRQQIKELQDVIQHLKSRQAIKSTEST